MFEIPQDIVEELAAPLRKLFAAWADELVAHERAVAAVEMAGSVQPDNGTIVSPEDWPWLRAQLRSKTELMGAVNPEVRRALDTGASLALDQEYIDAMDDEELALFVEAIATDVEVDALAIRTIDRLAHEAREPRPERD